VNDLYCIECDIKPITIINKWPKWFGIGCTKWPHTVTPSLKSTSLCGIIRCILDRQTDRQTDRQHVGNNSQQLVHSMQPNRNLSCPYSNLRADVSCTRLHGVLQLTIAVAAPVQHLDDSPYRQLTNWSDNQLYHINKSRNLSFFPCQHMLLLLLLETIQV